MGLRIQNNLAALNAHRNLSINDSNMAKSLEKLSSGFRINKASDDAAGLSVSQLMRSDITSYKVASRNVSEANAMLQVAEGAMDQVANMLVRLKELATQAASANSTTNLTKINAEGNKLVNEIDRIAASTEYAGTKLTDGTFGVGLSTGGTTWTAAKGLTTATGMLAGTSYHVVATSTAGDTVSVAITATIGGTQYAETVYGISEPASGTTSSVRFQTMGLTLTLNNTFTSTLATGMDIQGNNSSSSAFQVGAKNTSNDQIDVSIGSITSSTLGIAVDQLDTAAEAQVFLTTIDSAISTLSTSRGAVGASQNRLSYASATLATTVENTSAAESVIRDADMAAEMTNLSKNQILLQAGTAMLAQANQAPQQLLSLFR